MSCDRLFMADRDIVEVGAGDDLGYSVDGGIKSERKTSTSLELGAFRFLTMIGSLWKSHHMLPPQHLIPGYPRGVNDSEVFG